MSYTNKYTPPEPATIPEAELYGPDPYDVNWVFPVLPESLESERVQLVPFIPSVHAQHFWDEGTKTPGLWQYYPIVWHTRADFLAWFEREVRRNPANVYFAIIDKTRPDTAHPHFGGGSLAGVVGLFHSSAQHLSSELAGFAVLPAFQRTHVASNAVGILLKYCLQCPSASPPGLGLRRVQWVCHSKNVPSVTIAERMGFKKEGTLRFNMVLPEELTKHGEKPSETDIWPERYGRHTLMLSLCWDDWKNGGREVAQQNIDRKA